MVQWVDSAFGRLRAAIEAAGVWNTSLILASSDNGGQADLMYGGGSNFPLRGGKGSDFEGGTRVAAFASGGLIPEARRGALEYGIVHGADMLATVCGLVGAGDACREDARARAAGLPPLDSLDAWPLISGANLTSPRVELPISPQSLIQGQWKLITEQQIEATWSGPNYPNSSSVNNPVDPGPKLLCPTGCLFDVVADITEHVDVAAQHPDVVASMTARLKVLSQSFFDNSDDFTATSVCPPGVVNASSPCACWAALNVWGGYFGPWAWGANSSSA
jgi:arylsulfatase I/J